MKHLLKSLILLFGMLIISMALSIKSLLLSCIVGIIGCSIISLFITIISKS